MANPGWRCGELRDAVQEGDDDEPDDGEGGGGDHGVLLSPDRFRNSRARSEASEVSGKRRMVAGDWRAGLPDAPSLLRISSVRIPPRAPARIDANPPGSEPDPGHEAPCHVSHRLVGNLDTSQGRSRSGWMDYCARPGV
jgi:hypothetical protein